MAMWQRVDTESLNKPRPEKIRGVDVTVYFGEDDMPVGVRGEYDKARGKFVISFRYDSSEEATKPAKCRGDAQLGANAELVVGQLSERLYEVVLDVDAMDVTGVRLLTRAGKVLDDLPKQAHGVGLDRIDNYLAASNAFKQVRGKIESNLELAAH